MDFIKKNITLVIGIAIPIVMIVFVAVSIYLPGLFIEPQYDILFVSGEDYFNYYENGYQYSVQDNKLVQNELNVPEGQYYSPPRVDSKLYVYSIVEDEAREIDFAEAQNLHLDPSTKSPDGFEVVYGSRSGGFIPFFWGSGTDFDTRYLKGRNVSKKLNLPLNSYSYQDDFRFIGWIK